MLSQRRAVVTQSHEQLWKESLAAVKADRRRILPRIKRCLQDLKWWFRTLRYRLTIRFMRQEILDQWLAENIAMLHKMGALAEPKPVNVDLGVMTPDGWVPVEQQKEYIHD